MEYLDRPNKDDTPQAHPAYWRGKSNGIDDVLRIVSNIIKGKDNGTGENNHAGIESIRRQLLDMYDQSQKSIKK